MKLLETEIRQRIALDGPMPLAEFMTLCLTHPKYGYYTTGHPVGGRASAQRSAGDFITAPEVSQMFGELLGVWTMEVWQALGSPETFNLVEVGPGRGTLMADLLRVSTVLPGFRAASQIHLIEVSPTLSEQQSLTLSPQAQISWIRDIEALPDRPTILLANELLDALPFRQWCKVDGGDGDGDGDGDGKNTHSWCERAVGLVDDRLAYVLRPNRIDPVELPIDHASKPQGSIFESAPAREAFVDRVAEFINRNTGAALFIDYGHLSAGYGDTFQAIRDHQYADPLTHLGKTDLTSHVDFEPLVAVAKANGCVVPAPVTQGQFLLSLGLLERAGSLGQGKNPAIKDNLHQAVERLAGPEAMGNLFKVMAFGAPVSLGERWPGFIPD